MTEKIEAKKPTNWHSQCSDARRGIKLELKRQFCFHFADPYDLCIHKNIL